MKLIARFRSQKRGATLSTRELLQIQTRIERETGIRSLKDIRVSREMYIYHGLWPASASDEVEREVFVKVLFSDDPIKTERFERESWLYSHFRHDHLVRKEFSRTLNLGRTFGRARMIVLEFLDGLDASELLDYLMIAGKKIDLGLTLEVGMKVLKALSEVHQLRGRDGLELKIVHADVSPHNILLSRKGQVKLIDFGISRTAMDEPSQSSRIGKIGYASPEQVLSGKIDSLSDLYTMGIVLTELVLSRRLVGIRQIERLRIREQIEYYREAIENSDLADELKMILIKAVSENHGLRYQSALEFLSALEDVVQKHKLSVRANALSELVEEIKQFYHTQKTMQTTGFKEHQETIPPAKKAPAPEEPPKIKKPNSRVSKCLTALPYLAGLLLSILIIGSWKQAKQQHSNQNKVLVGVENPVQDEMKSTGGNQIKAVQSENPIPDITPWNVNIRIIADGAKIVVSDKTQTWEAESVLEVPALNLSEAQNFEATVSKSGFKTKTERFILTKEKPEFIATIALERLGTGSLFVGASPWAEINIPGYARQREIPFAINLPEGDHKITARYQDGSGKWQYLSQSVRINPNSRTKCLAYFEGGNKMTCR